MKQRISALLLPACAACLLASAALAQTPPASGSAAAAVSAPAARASSATDIEPRVNTSAPSASPAAAPRAAAKSTARAGAARTNADRIDLDNTQITGNRELPKVLYIVPWKRPELGDLVGRPLNSLLDEVLAPVDRDVFRRENRYFNALQTGGEKPAPTPVPVATPAAGSGAASSGAASVPASTPQPAPEPKPES
jgi:hypothetical protein